MIVVSLIALFVYLFGAYAYGSATVICARQVSPVWGPYRPYALGVRQRIDRTSLALFAISTVWFILNGLIEFRELAGVTEQGWLDLGVFIVYLFPPVIMHTVYMETHGEADAPPPAIYRRLITAMYLVSPLIGIALIASIFRLLPRPDDLGAWIGISIGSLFTVSSLFCTTIMLQRPHHAPAHRRGQMRTVMIFLFIALSGVFIALIFMRQERLLVQILDRVTRAAPVYFLIASIYFENRFEFYDLVVKRAFLLLLSVVTLGSFIALTLPWLEQLPRGSARPWLFAVALVPLAMLMPWLHARVERWLDRMWLGREFTSVEAVKHVLAAMQPATDEQSLVASTEAKLSDIFGASIVVLVGDEPPRDGQAIEAEVAMASPSGQTVRIAVLHAPGTRRVLSEDLALMRSLAGVFGYMLDNLRLQRRRQEQDLVAQDLRLQTSKSELKALRAQINPHFLFNALNAIASLIHTDPARADEAVEQLAEVFRYTLRRSESEWAPLDQELAFARAYLDVEQARFGQRLTCTIDSDHLLPPPQVPSMLLQTLIENAVKHGVSQQREPGRIDIVVRTTSSEITVEVRDTGPGANSRGLQPREGEGFGLRSVRERLKGYFGERASLSLTRDEAAGVTIARVVMPVVRMAA
ncbi:MAG: histidine kinase [Vicinamibacterales bacterium]